MTNQATYYITASFLWNLAFRVGTYGWNEAVPEEMADEAGLIMDDALRYALMYAPWHREASYG